MDLLKSDLIVHRWDKDGLRFYYTFQDGKLYRGIGVTSLIQKVIPPSFFLMEWNRKKGLEAIDIMNIAAEYGTLSHLCVKDLMEYNSFDLGTCPYVVSDFISKSEHKVLIEPYQKDWARRLPRDILAFNQFCIDYQVTPLATEMMLFSTKYLIGGAMDLLCELTIGSGQNGAMLKKDKEGKRVVALVDYKSKLDGTFYLGHEIQLNFYQMILKEMVPDLNIDIIANLSPKDWRSEPNYNFHIWKNDRAKLCESYLQTYRELTKDDEDDIVTSYRGNLIFKGNSMECFEVKSVSEILLGEYNAKEQKSDILSAF